MVISQGKKAEFKPYNKIADGVFDIRWGREDVVENVYQFNEIEDRYIATGEVKETSLCTYEIERFYGNIPSSHTLTRTFNIGQRIPSMEEMKVIGEAIGMTEEQMLPWMKEQLKRAIAKFDKKKGKDGVENFTISGVDVWMDKDTRTGLLLRFQAEKAVGKTDTVLWHEGMQFPLVVDTAIQMLYAIEVYASQTYDKTAEHLAAVDNLASIDALIAYDYKAGYPAQLAF